MLLKTYFLSTDVHSYYTMHANVPFLFNWDENTWIYNVLYHALQKFIKKYHCYFFFVKSLDFFLKTCIFLIIQNKTTAMQGVQKLKKTKHAEAE